MIKNVIKRNGTVEPFSADKINRWAEYAAEMGGNWSEIALDTLKRLSDNCSTQDILQTMIDSCLYKETIEYSRVAGRLEFAKIRKNMDYILNVNDSSTFKDILDAYLSCDVWDEGSLPDYNPLWEDWYKELKQERMEYWQVKQWSDKYACKLHKHTIETPHIGMLGIALAIHGDTQTAFDLANALVLGKINLPTPALNGCRNGDFDTISCCVISGGDTTDSIGVANWIAYKMTSKKAGIGIEMSTRSKGVAVKGGRVEHLGKNPIYKMVDKSVKCLTQVSRGGNATMTIQCIDPEIEDVLLWKSQRTDIETRIDKLDYSFAYNNAFIEAVIKDLDWYLFDLKECKEVYDWFYTAEASYEELLNLSNKYKHKTVKSRELLKTFLTVRQETGRFYSINVSRVNEHTPFNAKIVQSNLCVAPETQVLTRSGYMPIAELEGKSLDIWNGFEWSNVNILKTGTNQEMIAVCVATYEDGKFIGNNELVSTTYHKWYGEEGDEYRTFQLKESMWLLPHYKPNGTLVTHYVVSLNGHDNTDTYCFTEPKRNLGMFNGICTGQCLEIALPTKPYESMQDLYSEHSKGETAFCSLSAYNVGRIEDDEYEVIAELGLRTVDILIDRAPMMSKSMKNSIMERRSVGIGITGLANYLYKKGLDYDGSDESLDAVHKLSERHYYYLLKASQKLSQESGIAVKGIKTDWLPIDTAKNLTYANLDWESLRNKPRKHSVLVAHMPTESSAVLSNASNSIYPPRERVINKQSRKGLVQYICEDFVEGKNLLAWDVDNITLSKYYSRVQDFTDQAISCDYYNDTTKRAGAKVPLSQLMKEWVAHAKMGIKTQYYLNTKDSNGGSIQDIMKKEVQEEACESCKL